MNCPGFIFRHAPGRVLLALSCLFLATTGLAAPLTLYSTQFEAAEGFNTANDLAGQNGWTNAGTGGNGILAAVAVYGQSAYIGFDPRTTPNGLALWKPINHNPSTRPLVNVTLDMWVMDSTMNWPNRDEFSWEVYNIQGERLFALIFNNDDLGIYYQLDNDPVGYSGWTFTNDALYTVKIEMNFQANRWNAWVEGAHVITNKPISTLNSSLTFGDVDAVWLPVSTNGAGDNYLIFDNFTITAAELAPVVQPPRPASGGRFLIRVNGAEGASYAVEASTNLNSWVALKTNVVTGGYFDYLDTTSPGLPRRFYRARWVP